MHTYIHMYIHTYVLTWTYTYTYICICICICIPTCARTYTHISISSRRQHDYGSHTLSRVLKEQCRLVLRILGFEIFNMLGHTHTHKRTQVHEYRQKAPPCLQNLARLRQLHLHLGFRPVCMYVCMYHLPE